MIISNRLQALREEKESLSRRHRKAYRSASVLHLPRGNGHTVPAIETLEKMAKALEIPMH
jgi:hypothetical protein